jgi:hypothetical protein
MIPEGFDTFKCYTAIERPNITAEIVVSCNAHLSQIGEPLC